MKKAITFGLLTIGAIAAFGYKKTLDAKQVLDSLVVRIADIKNVRIINGGLLVDLKVELQNLSIASFSAQFGSLLLIKEIRIYNLDGFLLGKTTVNISSIDIPANSSIYLDNLQTKIILKDAASEFFTNFNTLVAKDFSTLTYQIDIEVLGRIFTINA